MTGRLSGKDSVSYRKDNGIKGKHSELQDLQFGFHFSAKFLQVGFRCQVVDNRHDAGGGLRFLFGRSGFNRGQVGGTNKTGADLNGLPRLNAPVIVYFREFRRFSVI